MWASEKLEATGIHVNNFNSLLTSPNLIVLGGEMNNSDYNSVWQQLVILYTTHGKPAGIASTPHKWARGVVGSRAPLSGYKVHLISYVKLTNLI